MLFLNLVLNIFSSYLISSLFKKLLILPLVFFSFVILNMEFFSLFHSINQLNVTIFSFVFFIISVLIFKYKKAIFLKFNFDFKRLKNSFLLDKILIILGIAFCLMLIITLFFAIIMPVLEPDSQTYHFIRAYDFIKYRSFNHFEINDIRALVMPINSEILYSWLYLFKRNLYGYGIFSYCSYVVFVLTFWDICEKFKYVYRKRLFAIFILSSLSAIILEIPSMQTDIMVGALVLLAFDLYIEKPKQMIYFSSLSLAIAMGVKSTGVMMSATFFILIFLYEKYILKKVDYKKIKSFSLYLLLNFLIFSSYNYILNFIHYGNFLSNRAALLGHSFWGGFKGYIANIINFTFQAFDFTGFKWGYYLNNKMMFIKEQVFLFLNIPINHGTNVQQDIVNIFTDEQTAGFGILGFLLFLPMICISLSYIKKENKRYKLLFLFAVAFILNILILSRAVAYMVFSIRFIVSYVCFSSIVLINLYNKKNLFKVLIVLFCLFYMTLIPICNRRMPYKPVYHMLKKNNYNLVKFTKDCYEGKVVIVYTAGYSLYHDLNEKYKDYKKIAIVKSLVSSMLYLTDIEEKQGRTIDFLTPTKLNYEKLKNYDLVILEDKIQNDNTYSTDEINIKYKVKDDKVIFDSDKNLNCYYKYYNFRDNDYIDYKDAVEASCFTYNYLIQNPNLKLDYIHKVELNTKNTVPFYFFVNHIDD